MFIFQAISDLFPKSIIVDMSKASELYNYDDNDSCVTPIDKLNANLGRNHVYFPLNFFERLTRFVQRASCSSQGISTHEKYLTLPRHFIINLSRPVFLPTP